MRINIHVHLDYRFDAVTDVLAQIEAAATPEQTIEHERLTILAGPDVVRIAAQDAIGTRFWTRPETRLALDYRATVAIARPPCDCATLPATPFGALPAEVVPYLLPSRYCHPELFESFVHAEFGRSADGATAIAMRDWIHRHFAYVPGVSGAGTTATETYVRRQGVCRDYAHVLITLARAAGIPARIASVYALGVEPQDFHAVAQVWLDGGWRLLDATGMATPDGMAIIGVGRDAADVAFLTAFGTAMLDAQKVEVTP